MTEAEFQSEVVSLAHGLGLAVFHSTDARRDLGKGYPDLTIIGPRWDFSSTVSTAHPKPPAPHDD